MTLLSMRAIAAIPRHAAQMVLLAFLPICAAAQTAPVAPASPAGPYRISGTVINAVSGEPIRHASVAVLSEDDSHAVESVLTDGEGHFLLSGLAATKFQLTASKRGFRSAFYDEHDEYSTAIVTGKDQDTSGFTFRLAPGAVLRGEVTGDGGDPVESARVMLFRRPHGHKLGERIGQIDTATTDDTGSYEFSNLPAGDYLVAVMAEPWYALHRASGGAAGGRPAGDGAAPLDVVYPVTFFDSTTDEASATPITLPEGGAEQANISLHAVPALHLFVQTPRRQDGSIARPELRQSIFGAQVSAESMGLFDGMHTGNVEFTGVAPGHYELAQGDPPRIVELDATANQQVDPSVGTPTVEVSGTLKSALGAALPAEITVSLEPFDGERRPDTMGANAARGSFRFAAVPPGKWIVGVQAAGSRLPVIGLTAGNRTQGGNLLTVGDRAMQITLTVSQGAMRVDGFARKDGKGFAGAMVVLVPKDLAASRELVRRDQSDSDGSFSLRDVAPGQYTIVAIQDGWDLDWEQPAVIGRYLRRGTAVTVVDTSGKLMTVTEAVQVQSP
jgi:hypothetical protein